MFKKFNSNDIIVNRIKTYPKVSVYTYSGSLYYSNPVKLFDMLPVFPPGTSALLKEDGCYLLTEDGYFILLETDE